MHQKCISLGALFFIKSTHLLFNIIKCYHYYNIVSGSCEVFSHLIGARGKDVLYVGDHVYGDILKSKKTVGWRTYLIIPELANEIYVWKKKKSLFDELQKIDNNLETIYRLVN
ncbi:unnamed protein product [Schistosoma mattheei]|uniref:Uncharacterized protein n=1 Tax=Schistosoma mattheei TaxID=31246 RepID=A0A3P8I8Y5_9TREM|nr:unnamed protein product [Schistosoma mattheei]